MPYIFTQFFLHLVIFLGSTNSYQLDRDDDDLNLDSTEPPKTCVQKSKKRGKGKQTSTKATNHYSKPKQKKKDRKKVNPRRKSSKSYLFWIACVVLTVCQVILCVLLLASLGIAALSIVCILNT
ncbi:unnamed protein product, partial [Mesorhabditis belari]|uniref:Uncharacterized protein n=1 Tax=Mesorhabditis belari TaxID=2138241 RepID=A0AAF3F5L1_9BILA